MTDLLSQRDLKTIESPQENETDMMFKVEATNPPERCPACGFDKLYKHSSRKQLIMYGLAHSFKASGLTIESQTIISSEGTLSREAFPSAERC